MLIPQFAGSHPCLTYRWKLEYGNRAVALAQLNGPRGAAEGLAALDALKDDAQVAGYQPYWAARAALLARTGHAQAAAEAYRRAIGLESDPAVRRFLQAELLRA